MSVRTAARTARPRLDGFAASGGVVWVLVGGLVVAASLASSDFRTIANLSNISQQAVVLSLVSLAQFFVVLTGGVDLSLGMVVKLSALATAITIGGFNDRTLLGVLVALAVGVAVGVVNGVVVTWLRVPAFMATFGTLAIVQGVSLLVTSTPTGQTSEVLSDAYAWQVGPVHGVVLMAAAVWLVAWACLHRTVWGRHVYAIGGDPQVAAVSGVRTTWVRCSAYVVAAVLATVGGILTAARAGVGDPNAGTGLEFESLAAVVIGGASLAGGRGRLAGVLGGVLLLATISNVFNLVGVDVWYQQLIKGLIILFGAAAYLGGSAAGRR